MLSIIKRQSNHFTLIMRIALPIIVQGLVFQLQAVVDKAFLGRIDTNYLSAVGIAQLPFLTSVEVLTAICTGLTIIVATKFGAGKYKDIPISVNASISFSLLFSLLLFLIWLAFPDVIFTWINVDETLLPYCMDYVRALSFFLILFGLDISLQAALQGMGKTKVIMYVGLVKVLLNILLAWLLIFGRFGFPAMHVKGAALAVTISNLTGSLILIAYFILSRELSANMRLFDILRFRWSYYKEIIRLGLPTGIEYLLWNVSNLVLISLLNQQDNQVVAIYTVTFTIEIFVYMIFNGIARATLTLVGNHIGAGNKKAAKSLMTSSILYSMIFVLLFCLLFALIPKAILSIFSNDMELIEASSFYLIVRGITMFPKSLNVVVGSGNRANGDVKWMLYTQIFGSVFVIVSAYSLLYGLNLGVMAIYLTLFLDELLRAILNTLRFYKGNAFQPLPFLSLKSKAGIQVEDSLCRQGNTLE